MYQTGSMTTNRTIKGHLHLGGSVSWASDSWFQFRSWSQGHEMQPHVQLCARHGACLRFSLSPSALPTHTHHSYSLSKKKKKERTKERKRKLFKVNNHSHCCKRRNWKNKIYVHSRVLFWLNHCISICVKWCKIRKEPWRPTFLDMKRTRHIKFLKGS